MKKTNAIRILEQMNLAHTLLSYEYDPQDLNVGKIAQDNGLAVEQVFKTLIAEGDQTGPLVAVVPGDRELSMKALAKVSGNKKVKLLPLRLLHATTGYHRGGCSPLGMKKELPVFLDTHAQDLKVVYVNAGTRGLFIGIAPQDLARACKGQWSALAQ